MYTCRVYPKYDEARKEEKCWKVGTQRLWDSKSLAWTQSQSRNWLAASWWERERGWRRRETWNKRMVLKSLRSALSSLSLHNGVPFFPSPSSFSRQCASLCPLGTEQIYVYICTLEENEREEVRSLNQPLLVWRSHRELLSNFTLNASSIYLPTFQRITICSREQKERQR